MKTRDYGQVEMPEMPLPKPIKIPEKQEIPEAGRPNLAALLKQATAAPAVERSIEIEHARPDEPDLQVKTTSSPGQGYVRQDLASSCVFYNFKEVFMRTIQIPDMSLLHAGSINNNISLIIDAIGACLNVDVRNITPEDFTMVMFWLKENSFPKTPMQIEHTTRYGNKVQFTVRRSKLKIVQAKITEDEYAKYLEMGICHPTVRDMELIKQNDHLSDDQKWLLEYSQYAYVDFKGDYTDYSKRKSDRLTELGPEILEEIEKFKVAAYHGIEQRVLLRDPNFVANLETADFLRQEARDNAMLANALAGRDPAENAQMIVMLNNMAVDFKNESDAIKTAIENGTADSIIAKEEVVGVSINPTHFFPRLR